MEVRGCLCVAFGNSLVFGFWLFASFLSWRFRCEMKIGRFCMSGDFRGGRAPLGPDPIPYSSRHFAMNEHISDTFPGGTSGPGT